VPYPLMTPPLSVSLLSTTTGATPSAVVGRASGETAAVDRASGETASYSRASRESATVVRASTGVRCRQAARRRPRIQRRPPRLASLWMTHRSVEVAPPTAAVKETSVDTASVAIGPHEDGLAEAAPSSVSVEDGSVEAASLVVPVVPTPLQPEEPRSPSSRLRYHIPRMRRMSILPWPRTLLSHRCRLAGGGTASHGRGCRRRRVNATAGGGNWGHN
jgi:hypothetical protein